MPQHFPKGPNDISDWAIDWSTWLGTDTITASTWTVPTGLTKVSDTFTTTETTIWLSGGVDREVYHVVNHIVTNGGHHQDGHIYFHMDDGEP
jgi:hypothetical protein